MKTAWPRLAVVAIALAGTVGHATPPTSRPAQRVLKFQNMQVDLTARKITLDTAVCLRQGQLELLLCKNDTKEYESILHTNARPAHLHAALLALGLMPGIAAEWSPQANDGQGALLPRAEPL